MATYEKRNGSWRVQVRKLGVSKSATFDTKIEAKEWAAETESLIKAGKVNPSSVTSLDQALERYALEVTPKKKGAKWENARINMLRRHPIAKIKLSDLSASDMAAWRDYRLTLVTESSVRREMSVLSSVFKIAINEWGWLKSSPLATVQKPSRSRPRDRRISEKEIKAVIAACNYQGEINNKTQLVAAYFLLALETAMRLGELCSVRENDFFKRHHYVLLSDTKNADARKVPLSDKAIELFESVFESGITVESGVASTLFRNSKHRAGIKNLRFHDTRHEALTMLAGKLSVLELARMVGHRDPKSLMIYYNATPSELASKLN